MSLMSLAGTPQRASPGGIVALPERGFVHLNGLRALAALPVILFHATLATAAEGNTWYGHVTGKLAVGGSSSS